VTGDFTARYGPWALVAGASEGIGAAFATALAGRGVRPILVARRPGPLAMLAARLPVESQQLIADLSTAEGLGAVLDAADRREVGLVVCNAAYAPTGPFLSLTPAHAQRVVDLNCRAPLALASHLLPAMVRRGRGGFIVVSSLAGDQGSPRIVTYAASKAFGAVLAEGLWAELRGAGVDVLACVAGAVRTPGYDRTMRRRPPGTVSPETVAEAALRALGRGPRTVPGALMRLTSPVVARLPRRAAIRLIGSASKDLFKS
jgi:uncharacterized protein